MPKEEKRHPDPKIMAIETGWDLAFSHMAFGYDDAN
jgi:hypothetical protein